MIDDYFQESFQFWLGRGSMFKTVYCHCYYSYFANSDHLLADFALYHYLDTVEPKDYLYLKEILVILWLMIDSTSSTIWKWLSISVLK